MDRADRMRDTLPYGKWTTKDGMEVLFNRHYQPIWKKDSSGVVTEANKNWWVPNILLQEFYYDDSSPPYGRRNSNKTKQSYNKCISALASFGVY